MSLNECNALYDKVGRVLACHFNGVNKTVKRMFFTNTKLGYIVMAWNMPLIM